MAGFLSAGDAGKEPSKQKEHHEGRDRQCKCTGSRGQSLAARGELNTAGGVGSESGKR